MVDAEGILKSFEICGSVGATMVEAAIVLNDKADNSNVVAYFHPFGQLYGFAGSVSHEIDTPCTEHDVVVLFTSAMFSVTLWSLWQNIVGVSDQDCNTCSFNLLSLS